MYRIKSGGIGQTLGQRSAQMARDNGVFALWDTLKKIGFKEIADAPLFIRELNATASGVVGEEATAVVEARKEQDIDLLAEVRQEPCTDSRISYIYEETDSSAATVVAEGGAIPEQSVDVAEGTATIYSVSVFTKVTSELVSDVPSITQFVDGRLTYAAHYRELQLLIAGTGSGQPFGLTTVMGSNAVTATDHSGVADALFYAGHLVRLNARREPNVIVMHPTTWKSLRTAKGGDGNYLVSAFQAGGRTMWDMRVYTTAWMPETKAVVADLKTAALMFRRSIQLSVTNSDGSDFERNTLAFRVTSRLGIVYPQANCISVVTGIQ